MECSKSMITSPPTEYSDWNKIWYRKSHVPSAQQMVLVADELQLGRVICFTFFLLVFFWAWSFFSSIFALDLVQSHFFLPFLQQWLPEAASTPIKGPVHLKTLATRPCRRVKNNCSTVKALVPVWAPCHCLANGFNFPTLQNVFRASHSIIFFVCSYNWSLTSPLVSIKSYKSSVLSDEKISSGLLGHYIETVQTSRYRCSSAIIYQIRTNIYSLFCLLT